MVPGPALSRAELIAKASTLPSSLLSFFARFPPPSLGPRILSPLPTTLPTPPPNFKFPELPSDPFTPSINPLTGTKRRAFYGRRGQASIAALARKHGVEELLPDTTVKKTGVPERRRIENGLRAQLRGNAVSPVKGHKWERTLLDRIEARKQAMLGMNKMIAEWKSLGHGRGWKTWPKRAGRK